MKQKWKILAHWLPAISGFTHASNPTYFGGNLYFSARDWKNRSHIFATTFDPGRLTLGKPALLLAPGAQGSFDESGCSVCQVLEEEIIYLGWNLGVTVPFYNSLCSWNGVHRKIIRQRDIEYRSISYGMMIEDKLWHGAVTEWPLRCVLVGHPGLEYDDIVSRFCVIGNEMWFCHRARDGEYQLKHARLENGAWSVNDELQIERGEFDSKSQCYPWVFDSGGERYMLYNGNGYGKTGFSLAVLDHQE